MHTLLLACLVSRLAFGLIYWATDPWEVVPLQGEHLPYAGTDGYLQLARNLWVEGRWAYTPAGPAVHNRPPLPSLLMTLAAWDTQYWYGWWLLLSTALHLLGLWFYYHTIQNLWGEKWARRLGWAFVLHPLLLAGVRATTFVPLATALLCGLLWAWSRYRRSPTLRPALWMGAFSGLLALTHGTLLPVAPLAALALWPRWRHGLAVLGLALLMLTPWTLRNYLTFDRLIPIATGAGIQYWKGESALYRQPDLEYTVYRRATGQPLHQTYFGPEDPADDALLLRLAIEDMTERPGHYLLRSLHSYLLFWVPTDQGWPKAALTALLNLPLLLPGILTWRRQHRLPALLLWLIPLPFALLAAITSYYLMLLPLLLLWATQWVASRAQQ